MRGFRKHRVLCIDRDPVSLSIRKALLQAGGFDATGHTSLRSAQGVVRQQAFHAVVVDENACANGREELARIAEAFSSLPVLVLQSRSPYAPNRLKDGHVWTFAKGEGPQAFLAAVRECIASGAGSRKSRPADTASGRADRTP